MTLFRADDQVRTGDLNLGKVALYQLSYIRVCWLLSHTSFRKRCKYRGVKKTLASKTPRKHKKVDCRSNKILILKWMSQKIFFGLDRYAVLSE
jgi:hypothetical protein